MFAQNYLFQGLLLFISKFKTTHLKKLSGEISLLLWTTVKIADHITQTKKEIHVFYCLQTNFFLHKITFHFSIPHKTVWSSPLN